MYIYLIILQKLYIYSYFYSLNSVSLYTAKDSKEDPTASIPL